MSSWASLTVARTSPASQRPASAASPSPAAARNASTFGFGRRGSFRRMAAMLALLERELLLAEGGEVVEALAPAVGRAVGGLALGDAALLDADLGAAGDWLEVDGDGHLALAHRLVLEAVRVHDALVRHELRVGAAEGVGPAPGGGRGAHAGRAAGLA